MRWVTGVVLGFVLGCVLTSGGQQAAPPSRMNEFLRKAGLRDALEQQRQQNLAFSQQQITQMIEQISGEGLPANVTNELKSMSTDMVNNVANAYTTDEALAVYARAWDRNYPGDEIENAMGQLGSAEGQRLTRTISEAISETTQFTQQRRQAAMQQETQRFVTRLRELMKDARAAPKQ